MIRRYFYGEVYKPSAAYLNKHLKVENSTDYDLTLFVTVHQAEIYLHEPPPQAV